MQDNAVLVWKTLFHCGNIVGIYQVDLSPNSSRSAYETCLLPVILHVNENWIFTEMTMTIWMIFRWMFQ